MPSNKRSRKANGILTSSIHETFNGIREVKLYGREQYLYDQFKKWNDEYFDAVIESNRYNAIYGPYIPFVLNICMMLFVYVGGNLIFTAGQIPLNPVTGELEGTDVKKQTEQVLKNVKAVLEAGGSSFSNVLKTTVFLKNMDDFAAMNEVYSEYFEVEAPARSAVEVSRLPKDVLVEIECIALV